MPQPAVFLDKDGTLIDDVPYNVDPAQICLTAGAIVGLKLLQEAGYKLLVISNQSGVARGYFPETALRSVWRQLDQLLAPAEVYLSGYYYCPHHPTGAIAAYAIDCGCRKPKPGLLRQAAQAHDLDLAQSWFVGDILNDVQAGRSAGCRTVLIDNGNETEWHCSPDRLPHHIVSDLEIAAKVILAVDQVGAKYLPKSDRSSVES